MKEIERKFLVESNDWKMLKCWGSSHIKQAYLQKSNTQSVRIRIVDSLAILTIKIGKGLVRDEYEYEIPQLEALEIIEKAGLTVLQKTRYYVENGSDRWEIDVFEGKLSGLCIAEIELNDENQKFELPNWITKEVTADAAYLNSNLIDRLL